MSVAHMEPDSIADHIAAALAQARIAEAVFHSTVIPETAPAKRAFPQNLARRIERRALFDEAFLCDLKAIVDRLTRQIAERTHIGWEADENHVRGGYEYFIHEDDVIRLATAARELNLLWETVARVLDAMKAVAFTEKLFRG